MAKLLVADAAYDVSAAERPPAATDISVGLTVTEAMAADARAVPLLGISIAYRTPMVWSSSATLYATAMPMVGVGFGQVGVERFAVPIGLVLVATEPRAQRGAGLEAGIGGGLTISGGAAEGVNLRPFVMAEVGAAIFKKGGLRLRYMAVPQGMEAGRTIPAYHGLMLVFGATVW